MRLECKRQMHNMRVSMVPTLQFMTVWRQYGINMTLDDQKDFFDFLSLGATKNHYNLGNLSKLFDILAKVAYKQQKEALRQSTTKKGEIEAVSDEVF